LAPSVVGALPPAVETSFQGADFALSPVERSNFSNSSSQGFSLKNSGVVI